MSQTKVKSGLLNFPDQTDFVKLPSGTTAQRPVSPEKGYSRYNTTDNKLEFWNGDLWQQLPGVVAPIITSVSYPGDDLAADPAGGQTITINGSDFITGATVTVGGTTPSVITFVSATQITFEAPAKAAGDYDIVVTNVDGGNATSVNGMAYNGVPSWTTPAGNLGSFPAGSTIPTITLVATEPDSGVISYSVTTGALPTGLTLTGANIDGNVPTPAGETTYNFSVTASDDENQSTERAFNIVVYLQVTNTVSTVDPFGDSSGVALYQLNGDATDVSGNYNATFTNPSYTTGVFGQAANFDTTNRYITTPYSYNWSGAAWTLSFWAKVNAAQDRYIMGTSQENGLAISARSTGVLFLIGGGNVPISYNVGEWKHFVYTYDGINNVKAYGNGVQVANQTVSITNLSDAIVLGKYGVNSGSNTFFNGSIDQFRVFDTELTPLEVSSLYEERTVVCGGQAETVDILGDNSCIALYPLDGNANDLSGNYSGTPTNVSYGVGEFDLAGVFNGTGSGGISTNLITSNTQDLTWSVWVKGLTHNQSGTANSIFTLYKDNYVWLNFNSNGTITGRHRASPSIDVDVVSGVINPAVWTNVVFVSSLSAGNKIYIDGSLVDSNTTSITSRRNDVNLGTGLYIGNNPAQLDGSYALKGSIDQVRIFNKALSAGEVTTLYNETACDVLACSGTTNTLDILGDGSCIAAYPLDGSPLDLSGNYNGVQTDVTYPVGKFDLGGSFNGSSSKINIPSSFGIGDIASFSVSLWAKSNNNAAQEWIGGKTTRVLNNHNLTIGPYNSSSQIRIFCGSDANDWVLSQTSSVFYDGLWHNYTFVKNGTNGYFYIDGVLFDSSNVFDSSTTLDPNADQYISASWDGSPRFKGEIDQVRIFNKALSAGEVTTLYNETACN